MRIKPLAVLVLATAAVAFAACGKKSSFQPVDGATIQTVQDSSDATQTSLEASGASDGTSPLFAESANAAISGSCDATRVVVNTATICAFTYPHTVDLTWNCTTAAGAQVVGSAQIINTVTNNNGTTCPLTGLTVNRAITLNRTRSKGALAGNLAGTANIVWSTSAGTPGRQKHLTYAMERKITDNSALVLHQQLTGDKTVQFAFDAPDTKTVNGTEEVKHLILGFDFTATETSLDYNRSCCYPVSGTWAFNETGTRNRSGSLTFGPACGDATTSSGDQIVLPPCE